MVMVNMISVYVSFLRLGGRGTMCVISRLVIEEVANVYIVCIVVYVVTTMVTCFFLWWIWVSVT